MITLTHKELQELINLEVSRALTESNNLLSSCYDMLTKMETKIEDLEIEILEKDKVIKELVDGMKKIILTKQIASVLQIPSENIWSVSSTSMVNIAKRTLKKLEIE
ncbi:MAG: hypothetical protein RBS24_06580 [Bacilli bacterium]|jgi:hypothetical protein|nr:hypothetical protein [Bacilli bacterium]